MHSVENDTKLRLVERILTKAEIEMRNFHKFLAASHPGREIISGNIILLASLKNAVSEILDDKA